jgi:ABC-type phosphate transport system substrate-binding protein
MALWRSGIVALLLLCDAFSAWGGNRLAVIVASSSRVQNLSKNDVARIFRRKTLINKSGNDWIPTNMPPDHPLRQQFSRYMFRQSPVEMQDFWNAQYFHGVLPPRVVDSEEAMLRFVSSTPGSIGYILLSCLDDRVKAVHIMTLKSDTGRNALLCEKH